MLITFCGHRQVDDSDKVKLWLSTVCENLILKGGKTFYLGGYGEFDLMVKHVLVELKKKYPNIEILLIVPYLNHNMDTKGYDGTIYPEIENTPPRFAISKRNKYMVEHAEYLVAYVLRPGGAEKTMTHARRKKKNIISYPNLQEI